jgi:hypothetical protein
MADRKQVKSGTPGIAGAISDAVDAVKSYVGAGRRPVTGSFTERQAAEDENNSSYTPSNAGMQSQSSDSNNKYN